MTIDPSEIPMPLLHSYLLGGIAPRPIAFASTIDAEGNVNLSPFSYFNVFSANPPILIFSPARSGRNNTTKHSHDNVKKVPEVVINMVNFAMVEQMSLSSTAYPKGVNEFVKSGFTPVESETVKPPRVKESPMQMECIVKDVVELGQTGGAGNLIICEIKRIHLDDSILDDQGKIDTQKLDPVGRMGGNFYVRAHGNALFEVEKPISSMGIGVDQIPEDIRNSTILSGNDLGKLGNVEHLPDETEVNDYKLIELSDMFVELEDEPKKLEEQLHKKAASLLSEGKVEDAWKTLLTFNNQ